MRALRTYFAAMASSCFTTAWFSGVVCGSGKCSPASLMTSYSRKPAGTTGPGGGPGGAGGSAGTGWVPALYPEVQPERIPPLSIFLRKQFGWPGGFFRKVKPATELLAAAAAQHSSAVPTIMAPKSFCERPNPTWLGVLRFGMAAMDGCCGGWHPRSRAHLRVAGLLLDVALRRKSCGAETIGLRGELGLERMRGGVRQLLQRPLALSTAAACFRHDQLHSAHVADRRALAALVDAIVYVGARRGAVAEQR